MPSRIDTHKASRGEVPLPIQLQSWGSVVSFPSGVRGEALAENAIFNFIHEKHICDNSFNIHLNDKKCKKITQNVYRAILIDKFYSHVKRC